MAITIEDIAKEAGVSIATVSRVMNNTKAVSGELKDRVNAVIEKNNFKPNALARGLITKTTQVIGVIVPDISNPINGVFVKSINEICQLEGYMLMLCESKGEPIKELELLKSLEDKNVDGVILVGINSDDTLFETSLKLDFPLVIVGMDDIEPDSYYMPKLTSVENQYYEEGTKAAQVLFELINGTKNKEEVNVCNNEHKIIKIDSLLKFQNNNSNKGMEFYLL